MKKCLLLIAVVMALACSLRADSVVQTVVVPTTSVVTSDQFTASGWLDRIEVSGTANATCGVVVASYDSSATAIETYATKTVTTPTVIRTRVIGTANTGTAITGVVGSGSDALTNIVTTVLAAPYERILIGGNVKAVLTGAWTATNTVVIRMFYEPLKR
jgi:hypothetical protein